MNYLKSEEIHIDGLERKALLRELNGLAQEQLMACHKDDNMTRALATSAMWGLRLDAEFKDHTVEMILDELSMGTIQEIAEKVSELSGMNIDIEDAEKNSDSTLKDVSSSG